MFAGGLKIKNVLSPNTFKHKHKCSCKKQRKENLIHAFTVEPLNIMPAKRFYLLNQIPQVKAAHLFQCIKTPIG